MFKEGHRIFRTAGLSVCTLLATSICSAVEASSYTTGSEFMQLFFDFSGSSDEGFPVGHPKTIVQMLAATAADIEEGPLVIVGSGGLFVYDENRKLVGYASTRTSKSTGFYEVTSVSHIGPAIGYLAQIKAVAPESGWKGAVGRLLSNIKSVRTLNARPLGVNTDPHWLDRLDNPAWNPFKSNIKNLVDYACYLAGSFLTAVQKNPDLLTADNVRKNFLEVHNEKFPIPYNNIMIGTFALEALSEAYRTYDAMNDVDVDWAKAKVIIRNQAGTNFTGGLSKGTNWVYSFVRLLTNNAIPESRIMIPAYAEMRPSVSPDVKTLPMEDFAYYTYTVWGALYSQSQIINTVMSDVESIELPYRPAIPGDWGFSTAADIGDFIKRLKLSLADNAQLLSNTVGFWVPQELASKNWDPAKVVLPGMNAGFPKGVSAYPENSPAMVVP